MRTEVLQKLQTTVGKLYIFWCSHQIQIRIRHFRDSNKYFLLFIYPNRFNPSWDSPAGQLPLCRTNKSTKTKPTPQRRRPHHLKFKAPTCSRLWIFFHTKFWQMENASLLWQNNCLLTEMPFTVSTNFQPSLSLPPAFKCLNRVFFSFSIPVASLPISTSSEYIPTCWM